MTIINTCVIVPSVNPPSHQTECEQLSSAQLGQLQGLRAVDTIHPAGGSRTLKLSVTSTYDAMLLTWLPSAECRGNPDNPENGIFACNTKIGGVCYATCSQGFEGRPSATCGPNGWGPVEGSCQPSEFGLVGSSRCQSLAMVAAWHKLRTSGSKTTTVTSLRSIQCCKCLSAGLWKPGVYIEGGPPVNQTTLLL